MTESSIQIDNYTTKLSDKDFDDLITKTLNEEQEMDPNMVIVQGMMLRTVLTMTNTALNHRDYKDIISESFDFPIEDTLVTDKQVNDRFKVHDNDILLNDYTDLSQVITYTDFKNIIKNKDPITNILTLRYKNGSFNVSIIEYSNNQENYQKNYAKGNIALYFIPSTIKRAAGKITAKGKDIVMKYSERLLKYGYRIKGSKIEGIAHTITDYDAESIAKSLRLINNAMHMKY